jgi:lipopolysaccharide/colanic/teichoic acid biosynthesis glycosyltransferase
MLADAETPKTLPMCFGDAAPTRRADLTPPRPTAPLAPPSGWYFRCKRGGEFVGACLLFVLAAPIIVLTAALVKLTSRGPAIYSQTRQGKGGRPFTLYKLRTMAHDCEKQSGVRWSTPGDPRITLLGRWLRCTHIDELPQLWNVLRGDMSLVGPRPERPEIAGKLAWALPHYYDRLAVRPGVTGLAQVQLPADTDLDSVRRKLAYDLYYIRRVGFWLDLRLITCTALRMVGVPFFTLGKLFVLPDRSAIENAYEIRAAKAVSVPEWASV